MAERTNAPALKAGGRKARGFESLPFRSMGSRRTAEIRRKLLTWEFVRGGSRRPCSFGMRCSRLLSVCSRESYAAAHATASDGEAHAPVRTAPRRCAASAATAPAASTSTRRTTAISPPGATPTASAARYEARRRPKRSAAATRRSRSTRATARRGGSRFTAATTVHELGEWWLTNVAPHRMRPSSVGTVGKRLTRDRLGVLADVAVDAAVVGTGAGVAVGIAARQVRVVAVDRRRHPRAR